MKLILPVFTLFACLFTSTVYAQKHCVPWTNDPVVGRHSMNCQLMTFTGESEEWAIDWEMGPGQLSLVTYDGRYNYYGFDGSFQTSKTQPWAKEWHPNLYVPANRRFEGNFSTFTDPGKRARTCGVFNQDGSPVKKLTLGKTNKALKMNDIVLEGWGSASAAPFVAKNGQVDKNNLYTLQFGAGDDQFVCRVFLRSAMVQHLACKHFKAGEFAGILGFLPMGQSFAPNSSRSGCVKK